MPDNENPIHAPLTRGRPREGDEPRVSRTISIDSRTNRALDLNLLRLRKQDGTATTGRVIDRMQIHCASTGFDVLCPDPAKRKPKRATTPASAPATSGKA